MIPIYFIAKSWISQYLQLIFLWKITLTVSVLLLSHKQFYMHYKLSQLIIGKLKSISELHEDFWLLFLVKRKLKVCGAFSFRLLKFEKKTRLKLYKIKMIKFYFSLMKECTVVRKWIVITSVISPAKNHTKSD